MSSVVSQQPEILCGVEGAPLGQLFRDPDAEAGHTVMALQPAAVRPGKDGTISPARLSTSASKRKTDTRIGPLAPRSRLLVHFALFDEVEARPDNCGSA